MVSNLQWLLFTLVCCISDQPVSLSVCGCVCVCYEHLAKLHSAVLREMQCSSWVVLSVFASVVSEFCMDISLVCLIFTGCITIFCQWVFILNKTVDMINFR